MAREQRQGQKMKEGMQQTMDRLLHDKNYLQMDYNAMKGKLQQHSELVKRQD